MSFKEFLLVVLVACMFHSPLKAWQSDWSPCHNTTDCGHLTWKTTVCVDCRNLGLNNLPEWNQTAHVDGLDLNGNNLSDASTNLGHAISLKYLSLSQNKIDTIGSLVNHSLEALKYVYLNGNRIKRLPRGTFGNLKQVKWLDLSSNRINHIDLFWAGNASRLEGLDLSSNLISALTRPMFLGLSSLKNLYLWDNIISTLDSGWSDGLPTLRHLIISHNRLSVISNITFRGLYFLETLQLQFNHITHIEDGWTQDLNNLKNLDVSFNDIAIINPQNLVNLTSLDTLNLRHNPIFDFDLPVNHVLPMLRTLYVSYIKVRNISLWLETIPQSLRILYVDDGQWNLTDKAIRDKLSGKAIVEEIRVFFWKENIPIKVTTSHPGNNLYSLGNISLNETKTVSQKEIDFNSSENIAMNVTTTVLHVDSDSEKNTAVNGTETTSPQKHLPLWVLLPSMIIVVATASFCIYCATVKRRRHRNKIHMRKKQSIVYVPYTESLKIRNSAASSRCGTLNFQHQDGNRIQGCSTDQGPRSERYPSGVAAAFSELRKVQCSSDTGACVVPKLGEFTLDSGYDSFMGEGSRERNPTLMISFKPVGYRQRRRNSLPDRPISQNKDGWFYEVMSDKIPNTNNAGNHLAKLSRDSKLLYQDNGGVCWTRRAERFTSKQMTKRKKTPKHNLLRSLSTPTEVESDAEPLWSECTGAPPPLLPRPMITLTRASSNGYEDVEMLLSQEWGRLKEGAPNKDLASALACRVDDNDCGGSTGEAELHDDVFDEEDNYIVVLPSETDIFPEAKEKPVDARQPLTTTAGSRIETPTKHQNPDGLCDQFHDSEGGHLHRCDDVNAVTECLDGDDGNTAFTEFPNQDDANAASTENSNSDYLYAPFTEYPNGDYVNEAFGDDGTAQLSDYPLRDVSAFSPEYQKQDDVNDTSTEYANSDDINAAFTEYPNKDDVNRDNDAGYVNGNDINAAFTANPNGDDFSANCPDHDDDDESLDDYAMGLSETDEEIIDDRIQLYGDDGKLLRIPSVRDSVLTGSTFDTVSLLLSLSSVNVFSSTSSFEFDDENIEEKPRKVSETHTL